MNEKIENIVKKINERIDCIKEEVFNFNDHYYDYDYKIYFYSLIRGHLLELKNIKENIITPIEIENKKSKNEEEKELCKDYGDYGFLLIDIDLKIEEIKSEIIKTILHDLNLICRKVVININDYKNYLKGYQDIKFKIINTLKSKNDNK